MLKNWRNLRQFDVRKIKPEDCERWAAEYVKESSPTSFNNTIGVLRAILQIGVERGIRYSNTAAGLKRTRLRKREFKLPSQNQFVTWADCDFDRGEIVVRGNPETGTKNSEIRRVPMIPDMRRLLERLQQKRGQARPEDPVMRVRECQGDQSRVSQSEHSSLATLVRDTVHRKRRGHPDGFALAWPQGWWRAGDESLRASTGLALGEHGAEDDFQ
jgi:hypothetical protein